MTRSDLTTSHGTDRAPVVTGHSVVRGHVVVAVNLLRTRLAEPWTLDALAGEVHLSRSQLVRNCSPTLSLLPRGILQTSA
jgi:AraC-like DNA-binding protein